MLSAVAVQFANFYFCNRNYQQLSFYLGTYKGSVYFFGEVFCLSQFVWPLQDFLEVNQIIGCVQESNPLFIFIFPYQPSPLSASLKVLYLSSPHWHLACLGSRVKSYKVGSSASHVSLCERWLPHTPPNLFPHVSTRRVRKWHWQLLPSLGGKGEQREDLEPKQDFKSHNLLIIWVAIV